MAGLDACGACGGVLPEMVRFCPFCGAGQRAAQAEPRPAPARAAGEPAGLAAGTLPAGPAAGPVAAARRPVVPLVVPVSPPVPPPPLPRAAPVEAARVPEASQAPPVPPPVRRVARPAATPALRAARARAARQLLLAAVILGCGAVLWRHLTGGPHGSLVVHLSRPAEGEVLVDGAEAGAPDQPMRLPPGRHVVGFAAPHWSTAPLSVWVRDGESRTVTLAPVPHRAILGLDSDPAGARLSLDGHGLGLAPRALTLPPGRYRVGAALAGHVPAQSVVTLGAGEQRRLVLALHPVPLRTLHVVAPAGGWSAPVTLEPHDRFALLFQGRIRVRAGGRVVLLDGAAPAELGMLDDPTLSFGAAGGAAVPVDVVVRAAASD